VQRAREAVEAGGKREVRVGQGRADEMGRVGADVPAFVIAVLERKREGFTEKFRSLNRL
jgi:hypothetical protein